jgi:hypothetical protein
LWQNFTLEGSPPCSLQIPNLIFGRETDASRSEGRRVAELLWSAGVGEHIHLTRALDQLLAIRRGIRLRKLARS